MLKRKVSSTFKRKITLDIQERIYPVLPWIHVKLLASHILGQMAHRIASDWERVYGHPVYFIETFVDPKRYRGTFYQAAN